MLTHTLTPRGIFIPAPTELEQQLIYTPPEQWADDAAREVAGIARRARNYAITPPTYEAHPWRRERADLVAKGWEQWLLWMEYDPC